MLRVVLRAVLELVQDCATVYTEWIGEVRLGHDEQRLMVSIGVEVLVGDALGQHREVNAVARLPLVFLFIEKRVAPAGENENDRLSRPGLLAAAAARRDALDVN